MVGGGFPKSILGDIKSLPAVLFDAQAILFHLALKRSS